MLLSVNQAKALEYSSVIVEKIAVLVSKLEGGVKEMQNRALKRGI